MTNENKPADSTATNDCVQCGQATRNPRFCGRSCAAKYNNRKSPKRSPEGKCKSCEAAIPTIQTYCRSCLEKQRQNLEATRQRPRVHVLQKTVFSFSCRKIESNARVGEFLDAFESVAEQKPQYLLPEDWQRHLDFVEIMRSYQCSRYQHGRDFKDVSAMDFPLNQFRYLLRRWVQSAIYSKTSHPLAATLALDTSNVLIAHAFGESFFKHQGNNFELEAMVDGEHHYEEIADQRLKKELTENTISGMQVLANLPNGATASIFGEPVKLESQVVRFSPERCHLSTTWDSSGNLLSIDMEEPLFDISHNFEFSGQFEIEIDGTDSKQHWEWWKQGMKFAGPESTKVRAASGCLPIRWISHCSYYPYTTDKIQAVPNRWTSFDG